MERIRWGSGPAYGTRGSISLPARAFTSSIHHAVRAERLAVLPRAEHVDVVAPLRAPHVHGVLLVHLADVDLHRQPAGVVADFQIAVMLVRTDHRRAQPSALPVRHALVRRVARVP